MKQGWQIVQTASRRKLSRVAIQCNRGSQGRQTGQMMARWQSTKELPRREESRYYFTTRPKPIYLAISSL